MKIIKYNLVVCALMMMFLGCSPDDNGSYGETVDKTVLITGAWKMKTVYQIDLDAFKKSFPDFATKVDITNAITDMPFSDFVMTLNNGSITTSMGNSPMSYIINEGEGTWQWISDDEIELVNQRLGINASNGIKTIIGGKQVDLYIKTYSGISGSNPILSLYYSRVDSTNSEVLKYEYILEKK